VPGLFTLHWTHPAKRKQPRHGKPVKHNRSPFQETLLSNNTINSTS